MIKIRKESNEVLYPDEDIVYLDKADLTELKKLALKNPKKNVRLCAHTSPKSKLHEMFIVHPQNMYVRPHKHKNKSESLLVLSGEAEYIIFNDNGDIKETIPLSVINGKGKFYVKINKSLYHTLNIYSKWFIFLEITKGPFTKQDTIFPKWAPDPEDSVKIKKYMTQLNQKLKDV